ncbi:MAG: hypothetical protein R6W06_03650 [Prochlorococcaceae cyanobacterium]
MMESLLPPVLGFISGSGINTGSKLSAPRLRRIRKIRLVMLQVALLCSIKIIVHWIGLERISVSPLFSAIVASTVFLLGFLLSGVLADFKESEKIPGELSTSFVSLVLEIQAIPVYNPGAQVGAAIIAVVDLGRQMVDWLQEKIKCDELLASYWHAHVQVVGAAAQLKGDASTLRGRLMQDLSVVLQKINRVQTIRGTTFVPLVYWMADIAAVLLFAGLVMSKSGSLVESVFFLAVISFVVILLLRLIDDLDNPFGASDPDSAEDVSIEVLRQAISRLGASQEAS